MSLDFEENTVCSNLNPVESPLCCTAVKVLKLVMVPFMFYTDILLSVMPDGIKWTIGLEITRCSAPICYYSCYM